MSADSKSQPSNQPPLSQLWPGFGSTSSELNNPMEQLHPQQSAPTSLSMEDQFAKVEGNQNSNYEDVFSFIHNIGSLNNNNHNKGNNNNGNKNSNHQQQTQQLKQQQYNVSL
ncbi:signal transducer and activator of transcription A-like [Lucilia cuprina]|uniref:signal transducer and activator of transcription A-like n=1 Tax=Lucilia cuprina TaxID=7375 RepID=UPI001F058AC0|nr:signal transducer and activator of transcription A-like [Lucilia cuprina]